MMPVRIFRGTVERKIEKDIIAIEDEIDRIEKELEGEGMEIRNINHSHYGLGIKEFTQDFETTWNLLLSNPDRAFKL